MHPSLTHWIRTGIAATALVGGLIAVAPGAFADTHDHYQPGFLRQAERALDHGSAQRALDILGRHPDRQLKSHHDSAAEGLACRALLALNRPAAARDACTAALETRRDRSAWQHFNNLGVAELALGNLEAAAASFQRAAVLGGRAAAPRHNLELVRQLQARPAKEAGQVATGAALGSPSINGEL